MKIKNKIISGWSKSNFSNCNYFEAETVEQIADCFELAKKNKNLICFRGGGRSYGDNTLNKNNIVLSVCDSGSMIPKHISKDLLSNPISSDNGLGIGLYQANKQAEMFGYALKLINNQPGRVCFELSRNN